MMLKIKTKLSTTVYKCAACGDIYSVYNEECNRRYPCYIVVKDCKDNNFKFVTTNKAYNILIRKNKYKLEYLLGMKGVKMVSYHGKCQLMRVKKTVKSKVGKVHRRRQNSKK